jgi:hypothetical protein
VQAPPLFRCKPPCSRERSNSVAKAVDGQEHKVASGVGWRSGAMKVTTLLARWHSCFSSLSAAVIFDCGKTSAKHSAQLMHE